MNIDNRSMPTTKQGLNCRIEIGHVKQHLLLRRHDIQTDERDCNGNTTSTALRDYILRAARIKIPPTVPEPCHLLQTLYRRRLWNLVTSPKP